MKKFITSIIAVLILALLPMSVFAAEQSANLATDFIITYNGIEQNFTDGNGKPVAPIELGGTTYLPVRAVSNLAGLNVGWDEPTNTVSLTTGGAVTTYDGAAEHSPSVKIAVEPDPTLVITMDGTKKAFKDGNGKTVYPFVYKGTTYLPVRAVCNLVNIPVGWDAATQTVILGTKPEQKPAEIPAGAKVLTWDDTIRPRIISDVYYEDGAFYIKANGYVSSDRSIDFINNGYKTVTFTVTTDDAYDKADHEVIVAQLDTLENTRLMTENQGIGMTKTYTVDIGGYNKITLQVRCGAFANAVLTNVYLTK